MKNIARILVSVMLLTLALTALSLFPSAADAAIREEDHAELVKNYFVDFENYITGSGASVDRITPATFTSSEWNRTIIQMKPDTYVADEKKPPTPGTAALHELKTVSGSDGKALVYTYIPGTHTNGSNVQSDFLLRTQYFCYQDLKLGDDNLLSYDFAEFSFSLYFSNIPETMMFKILNGPNNEQNLFFIESDGSLYLRTFTNTGFTNHIETDFKLAQLTEGTWYDFRVQMIPQEGTVGLYDYQIWLDGELCTWEEGEEGGPKTTESVNSMIVKPGQVDNLGFNVQGTQIALAMGSTSSELTETMTWAIDNVGFDLYKYTVEDTAAVTLPEVGNEPSNGYVPVWNSSFITSDDIINVSAEGTKINGDSVVYFAGVPGASATDPAYQVQGSYSKDGFSVSLSDAGEINVSGGTMTIPLGQISGNKYLAASQINANFRVKFTSVFSGSAAFSIDGTSLGNIASGAAEIKVEGGKLYIGGVEATGVALPALTDESVLTVTFPGAFTVSGIEVAEERQINNYYIGEGEGKIYISEARANYLIYMKAQADAGDAPTTPVLSSDYNTADRTAVRPLGRVQFDGKKYYYGAKPSVNIWGTSVNAAYICDVTFWGQSTSNTVNPEKQAELQAGGMSEADAKEAAKDGLERNYYLLGWQKLYIEDGAFVTQIAKKPMNYESMFPENDSYTFNAGFQANLKKKDGVKEMEGGDDALVAPYFRYTFSIWYDNETFTDDGFTFKIGFNKKVGDDNAPSRIMFTVQKGNGGYGELVIPTTNCQNADGKWIGGYMYENDPDKTDVVVALQNGWNTIEMVFNYESAITLTQEIKNDAGVVERAIDFEGALYNVNYTINSDPIYYDDTDLVNGTDFKLLSTFNVSTEATCFVGSAKLVSDGTEAPSQLQKLAVRDFMLEHLYDGEVDVNYYEKGTVTEDDDGNRELLPDVLLYSDFDKSAIWPTVAMTGTVDFLKQNKRLIVTHTTAGTATVGYTLDADQLARIAACGAYTFDFSLFMPETGSDSISVKLGDLELLTISDTGLVKNGAGTNIAQLDLQNWSNISVCVEKIGDEYFCTVYACGEIVDFRAGIGAAVDFATVSIIGTGDADDTFRLDSLAISCSNIPTSLVYMMPVTYVLNGGQIGGGNAEDYHTIGTINRVLPTAGKANAMFVGWYLDEALSTKALINIPNDVEGIKASNRSPVVLYAKYNYRVSFDVTGITVGDKPVVGPVDVLTYGSLVMPEITGVVYWRAEDGSGSYIYLAPGEIFNVTDNMSFVAVSSAVASNATFIREVGLLDRAAMYDVLYAEVQRVLALYDATQDKTDAGVVEAKRVLDEEIVGTCELVSGRYVGTGVLGSKLAAAENFRLDYIALADSAGTYADRMEMYDNLVNRVVGTDSEGNPITLQKSIDATVFEIDPDTGRTVYFVVDINSELHEIRRDLERINEHVFALIEAYRAYEALDPNADFYARYTVVSKLYTAYNNCLTQNASGLVAVGGYTLQDFLDYLDVKLAADQVNYPDRPEKWTDVAGYTSYVGSRVLTDFISAASTVVSDMDAQITAVNNEFLGLIKASNVTMILVEGRLPRAIYAIIDDVQKAINRKFEAEPED